MPDRSLNILAVSLAFPPLAYPRSIQVARLLAHADASTALFCASEAGARKDATIEPAAEKQLAACIRVPVRNGRTGDYIDRITYKFARSQWNRRNLVPDQYGPWRKDVIDSITHYLKNSDLAPDVVVTFAQPFSDHLIGLELRSRLGLPWLAHFSDPWVDNPFSPFDEKARNANLKLEGQVAENADILAFTSQETIDLFFAKYRPQLKEKARLLPQSFDPRLFENAHSPRGDKILIRYIGNFYGRRTPRPLISALTGICRRSPELLKDAAFELIGAGDADEVRRLSSELPAGLLNTRPSVSYQESLDLMMSADGLLVIDAPAETSVFLPSKLIDYIGARRPVLGITPKGSAESLIREIGGRVADPADVEAVAAAIDLFVRELRERRSGPETLSAGLGRVRDRYSIEQVAADFRAILTSMTISPATRRDLVTTGPRSSSRSVLGN
jgi:glycosyltransferase involved in cell wall biosynthesis